MALTINDIKLWLQENRDEYQKLKAAEFPPFDNAVYTMYWQLKDLIEYYKFKNKCEKGLLELQAIVNTNFGSLIKWTKKYEILGSQDLLMFEVNYINWHENVNDNRIKIQEGLYTDRKPFMNILCFCKVYQHLYWDNSIHKVYPTDKEKSEIVAELQRILNTFYDGTIED